MHPHMHEAFTFEATEVRGNQRGMRRGQGRMPFQGFSSYGDRGCEYAFSVALLDPTAFSDKGGMRYTVWASDLYGDKIY